MVKGTVMGAVMPPVRVYVPSSAPVVASTMVMVPVGAKVVPVSVTSAVPLVEVVEVGTSEMEVTNGCSRTLTSTGGEVTGG